jgi:hypothetical protein
MLRRNDISGFFVGIDKRGPSADFAGNIMASGLMTLQAAPSRESRYFTRNSRVTLPRINPR